MVRKTKKVLILLISLSVFFISASASATLITVGFDPSSIISVPGDTFSTDLIVNIDLTSPISSFGLDITFDSDILDIVGAVVDSSTFGGSTVDFTTDGLIELTGFVFPPPFGPGQVSGGLTLPTLTFLSVAVGTTALTPEITIGDPTEGFGIPFPPGGLVSLSDITLEVGSVLVVPVPATMLLLGTGLAIFAGFRKKFKKS